MSRETKKRKEEHIEISLTQNNQSKQITTGFEDICFVHKALPGIDKDKINLSVSFLDHKFVAPLLVGAITGGISKATQINSIIAEAVEQLGLGMGIGSQRAAIEDIKLEKTFSIARKKAPTAFIMANIGGIQLVNGYGVKEAKNAIKMIDADAIAIHLNALQETIQPEGQTNFKGVFDGICELSRNIDKPVIVKETGAGISAEVAEKLEAAGVAAIDVSGVGGTTFAAVEYYRTKNKNIFHQNLGDLFWDWGIPTGISIIEVCNTVSIPVVASGGIRSGIDIAKALALGSNMTSLSQPILQVAIKGLKETKAHLLTLMNELRTAMFLIGAEKVDDLPEKPLIISGKTAEWLRLRGFYSIFQRKF